MFHCELTNTCDGVDPPLTAQALSLLQSKFPWTILLGMILVRFFGAVLRLILEVILGSILVGLFGSR
jgi:hypothetical protein